MVPVANAVTTYVELFPSSKVYIWLNLIIFMKTTMIKLSVATRELLKQNKIMPRESYDGVINRLMAEVIKDEQEDRREEEVIN